MVVPWQQYSRRNDDEWMNSLCLFKVHLKPGDPGRESTPLLLVLRFVVFTMEVGWDISSACRFFALLHWFAEKSRQETNTFQGPPLQCQLWHELQACRKEISSGVAKGRNNFFQYLKGHRLLENFADVSLKKMRIGLVREGIGFLCRQNT